MQNISFTMQLCTSCRMFELMTAKLVDSTELPNEKIR